jgi:hypothetical protein
MENRVKVLLILLAFFMQLFVWNSIPKSYEYILLFIVILTISPFIWLKIINESNDRDDRSRSAILRLLGVKNPFAAILFYGIIILIIISNTYSTIQGNQLGQNILLVYIMEVFIGLIWCGVIRDLEIGN